MMVVLTTADHWDGRAAKACEEFAGSPALLGSLFSTSKWPVEKAPGFGIEKWLDFVQFQQAMH